MLQSGQWWTLHPWMVPRKGLTIPSVQRALDSESKERLAKVLASRT